MDWNIWQVTDTDCSGALKEHWAWLPWVYKKVRSKFRSWKVTSSVIDVMLSRTSPFSRLWPVWGSKCMRCAQGSDENSSVYAADTKMSKAHWSGERSTGSSWIHQLVYTGTNHLPEGSPRIPHKASHLMDDHKAKDRESSSLAHFVVTCHLASSDWTTICSWVCVTARVN